jgi:hypothetical protein
MAFDSKAHFQSRLNELGIANLSSEFTRLGWDTMSAFAFSANYIPGRSDDSNFISEVVIPLTTEADSIKKPALRRLFFEAYSMAATDVQRRSSRTDDDERPKKLPVSERADRFKKLQQELAGVAITGNLEPSNTLVDKFTDMEESGELRYLRWEELTRRDQEVQGHKKDHAQ